MAVQVNDDSWLPFIVWAYGWRFFPSPRLERNKDAAKLTSSSSTPRPLPVTLQAAERISKRREIIRGVEDETDIGEIERDKQPIRIERDWLPYVGIEFRAK